MLCCRSVTAGVDSALPSDRNDKDSNRAFEVTSAALERQPGNINGKAVDTPALDKQLGATAAPPLYSKAQRQSIPGSGVFKTPLAWFTGGASGRSSDLSDSQMAPSDRLKGAAPKATSPAGTAAAEAVTGSCAATADISTSASGSVALPAADVLTDNGIGSSGPEMNKGRQSDSQTSTEAVSQTVDQAALPQPQAQGRRWHWGPPDPGRAAMWAGARAARFASPAVRGAAQLVSFPLR